MSDSTELDLGNSVGKSIKRNVLQLSGGIMIAVLVQSFLVQPFWIPTGSMKPSLLVGDFVVVNKMAYGYSHASCPSLKALGLDSEDICGFLGRDGERIGGANPERGDVVVFRHRANDSVLIKRVIGLPGDKIRMAEGQVLLNGELLPQEPAGVFKEAYMPQGSARYTPSCSNEVWTTSPDTVCEKDMAIETLPGGQSYGVLDIGPTPQDDTLVYTVPADQYFVMGDNRDNSTDSRFQDAMSPGFVGASEIVGRARHVAFSPAGDAFWKFWTWRLDRFWHRID